jgi:hypothetical protein
VPILPEIPLRHSHFTIDGDDWLNTIPLNELEMTNIRHPMHPVTEMFLSPAMKIRACIKSRDIFVHQFFAQLHIPTVDSLEIVQSVF